MDESKNVISIILLHTLGEQECYSELGENVHVWGHSTVFFHFCVNSITCISLSHLNLDLSTSSCLPQMNKAYTFS